MAWQQGLAGPCGRRQVHGGPQKQELAKEQLMACFEQCPDSCSLAAEFNEVCSAYDTRHKHSPQVGGALRVVLPLLPVPAPGKLARLPGLPRNTCPSVRLFCIISQAGASRLVRKVESLLVAFALRQHTDRLVTCNSGPVSVH